MDSTSVVQTAIGHRKESVVVDAKQQLRKLRTWVMTSYARENFKQQAWLTLKTLHTNKHILTCSLMVLSLHLYYILNSLYRVGQKKVDHF